MKALSSKIQWHLEICQSKTKLIILKAFEVWSETQI